MLYSTFVGFHSIAEVLLDCIKGGNYVLSLYLTKSRLVTLEHL